MTRGEIAADLRRHTGGGMITPGQLTAWLGMASNTSWRVSAKYLKGLEHVGNRYFIPEVADRIKNEMEV